MFCYIHFDEVRNRECIDRGFRSAAEVAERIEWLALHGVKRSDIVRSAGVSEKTLTAICAGTRGRVRAETARRIFSVEPRAVTPHNGAYVPAIGSMRRLRALHAIGYTTLEMAAWLDCHKSGIRRLMLGEEENIRFGHAEAIDALFRNLQGRPVKAVGNALRAINRSRRRGWSTPFEWDEDSIDDPAAMPVSAKSRIMRFPEKYAEMREIGLSDRQVAERMGIKYGSLQDSLRRYDMPMSDELRALAYEE